MERQTKNGSSSLLVDSKLAFGNVVAFIRFVGSWFTTGPVVAILPVQVLEMFCSDF